MSRKARTPAGLRLAAAASAALPALAVAGSYELAPQVEVGGVYETNPRFLQDCQTDPQSGATTPTPCGNQYVMGTFLDARVRGSWRTPDTVVSLTPRVRDWNYLGSNKDLNNNDIYVDGTASQRLQRAQLDLTALYSDTLVRQLVFESATPQDPNGPPPSIGGSGRVADDGATEQRWQVSPRASYKVSTRNDIAVGFEYSDVTFDGNANPGFFDFDSKSLDVSLTHSLDQRNAVRVGIYGSTFDASNADRASFIQQFANNTDTFGVNAVYEKSFSETLSGTLQVGTARNSVTVFTPLQGRFSSSDTTILGNVGVRRRSEKTTLNLDVGRTQVPRSDGRQITQDQVRLYVDRVVTPRVNAGAGVLVLDQSGIGDFDRFDQTYYAVDLNGAYRLDRDWTVQVTYTFQTNETNFRSILDIGQDTAAASFDQSNRRLLMSVTYRGLGIRR